MTILRKFALAEPEGYNREPAREVLKSLFHCYLSGTKASPEQRGKIAKALVSSSDENERELGFDLIEAGLKASHFVSHYGFEFGARRRDFGWHPKNVSDLKNWFKHWIEIVSSVGQKNDGDGAKGRRLLGDAFRDLWEQVGLDDELVDIAKRFRALHGWPEGWLGSCRVLQMGAKSMPPESLSKLEELAKMLSPRDLYSQIRTCVFARGTFLFDSDIEETSENGEGESTSISEKYRRAGMKAEMLGASAAHSPKVLEKLIPDLCSEKYVPWGCEFGRGIGRNHPDVARLLEHVRMHIQHAECEGSSPIWIRGLLSGWRDADSEAFEAFLDAALEDAFWCERFVELQVQSDLDDRAFARVLRALDSEHCSTWQFIHLTTVCATGPLTVSQIMVLSNKLASRPDHGLFIAVEILYMAIHCAKEKDEQYKLEFGEALLEFFGSIDWSLLKGKGAKIDYDLGSVLEFALQSVGKESKVAPILRRILPMDEKERIRYDDPRKSALKPFFKCFPMLALELVYVPGVDGRFERARRLVALPNSELQETAVGLVPSNVLVEWCEEKPGIRFAFAAGTCKLFEKLSDEKNPLAISETAVALFASAPEKSVVTGEYIKRFMPKSWSGSLAKILESRLPLLDQLASEDNETFRREIDAAKADLQAWIDAQREQEGNFKRTRYSSFE